MGRPLGGRPPINVGMVDKMADYYELSSGPTALRAEESSSSPKVEVILGVIGPKK